MKSIRAQLTLRLLIGGALLLGAAGIALHWQVRVALTGEFDATLRATAQSLASLTEQKQGHASFEFAGENMPQFERANGPDIFLIRTSDGREIERSASLGTASLPLRAGSPEAPELFDTRMPDGRTFHCAGLRFTPQEEEDDERKKRPPSQLQALLVIGRDRAPLDHTLAELRSRLLIVGTIALVVLATLVRWGVSNGLAPLARLGENVATVDAASLSTRFATELLPAELRPIATRLNELLSRLESAFARERRFTATAAHELRTPLAELRALAEVSLGTPATEAEQIEAWRDTLATTRRMESLALRLLDLSRAEDPTHALRFQSIQLVEALATAWQAWAGRAGERGIALVVHIPPALTVITDPTILGVILGNLCANAAEHGLAGKPLEVRASATTDFITLHFQNDSGDLSAKDLPHLFERFWRKDTARTDARHHGLGLALAVEFAILLGGSLSVRLLGDNKLEFALVLPAH